MHENDKLEILEAVHALAGHVDEQFTKTRTELRGEIGNVRTELKAEISSVRTELLHEMRDGFDRVENLIRKGDKKTDRLTEKLLLKGIIDVKETREIMEIGPFPVGS